MVFCPLCKDTKATTYNWSIHEHGAVARIRKFKICDDCACLLLRKMSKKIMGLREEHDIPNPLIVSKTGVINEIAMASDNSLEITIDLDIGKARRDRAIAAVPAAPPARASLINLRRFILRSIKELLNRDFLFPTCNSKSSSFANTKYVLKSQVILLVSTLTEQPATDGNQYQYGQRKKKAGRVSAPPLRSNYST